MAEISRNDIYNKQNVYNKKIAPLIKQIQIICIDEQIPMFFSCAVENDFNHTQYRNEMVLAESGMHLQTNKIGDCLLALNGCKTSPPEYVKRAASTLQEYLGKLVNNEEEKTVDLNLYQDFIHAFRCISDGDFSLDFEKTLKS